MIMPNLYSAMIKCNTIKCKYNKNGYCTKEWNIKVDISDHPSNEVRLKGGYLYDFKRFFKKS